MLVRTGVFGTLRVNPDVRVFGFVRLDSYAGNANQDSPLFEKKTGVSAGVGFAWTLARSARSANE
jgi:outer membrane scaffolding protein for murein synthesis (MipA/OmpV family)